MKDIVIIGADDLGKEVVWLIEDINKTKPTYLILGFLDDDPSKAGNKFCGYKVLGKSEKLRELYDKYQVYAAVAVVSPEKRKSIVQSQRDFPRWETLIHPNATIAESSIIGKGCLLFPNATISVECIIGDFCLFHMLSAVGSDCKIGSYSSMMTSSSISGHSVVGECCYMEAHSCLYPYAVIGRNVHIEFGAVANKNCADNSVIGVNRKLSFFC